MRDKRPADGVDGSVALPSPHERDLLNRVIAKFPIPVIIHDENGRVLQISQGWTRFSGYTLEDLPTVGDWTERAYGERRKIDTGERVIATKNGSKRVWDFMTTPLDVFRGKGIILTVAVDVTDRRSVEEALRQTEERLRQGVRVAGLGIFEHDHSTDTIYWSPEMRAICGWSPDETVTLDEWIRFVHPEDRDMIAEAIRRAHDPAGDGLYEVEHRIVLRDGSVRWVRIKSQTFFERESALRRPVRTIGALLDITEHRLVEEQRERLLVHEQEVRAAAESASRLKDEFLGLVSHELRTPLTAIIGWTRLIRTGKVRNDQLWKAIETIDRNAERQVGLVDEILDLSRIITGRLKIEFEEVELASVISSAVESIRPDAEDRKLAIDIGLRPLLTVAGSPQRLEQVFCNLLSNAVKFTDPGGRLTVRLDRSDSFAEARVSDTGIGIPCELLPHIFDRFRQADVSITRRHQGLGLGLTIVRQLVTAHGGSVRAESPGLGYGATFTVRLPLIEKQARERSAAGRGQETKEARLEGVRALVIEDDADARELITASLVSSGALVRSVEGYPGALRALEQECPDILLIDIGIPDYSGYVLLEKIRGMAEKFARIPAIAVTARASEMDRDTALTAGFHAHVSKPFEPDELVRLVGELALAHPRSGV